MFSDEQLVQTYRNGDEKAFEELFERYRRRIFRYVLRMLQNTTCAEEVFQEIFLRVHSKLARYREQDRFAQWLFTIANHACLDELRRRKRTSWLVFSDEPGDSISETNPEKDFSRSQMRQTIFQKLHDLDIKQRQVFLLRIEGGLMFREIAELLKEPLNTVLSRYHQAILSLKTSLTEATT